MTIKKEVINVSSLRDGSEGRDAVAVAVAGRDEMVMILTVSPGPCDCYL